MALPRGHQYGPPQDTAPQPDYMARWRQMEYLDQQSLLRHLNQQRMLQGRDPAHSLDEAMGGGIGRVHQTEPQPLQVDPRMFAGRGNSTASTGQQQDSGWGAALASLGGGNGLLERLLHMRQQGVPLPRSRPAEAGPAAVPNMQPTSGVPYRGGSGQSVQQLQSSEAGVRKGPLNAKLLSQLEYAAEKTGLQVKVTSGGQPSTGNRDVRLGSHRHDWGGAADLSLIDPATGRTLDMRIPADAARMADFTTHAVAAGATGVGAGVDYMGPNKIHIGGGAATTWGGAPWVPGAVAKGRANPVTVQPGRGEMLSPSAPGTARPPAPPAPPADMPATAAVPYSNAPPEMRSRGEMFSPTSPAVTQPPMAQAPVPRTDALAAARQPFAAELQNPQVREQLFRLTAAENPENPHAFMESVMNRAAARGQTLQQTISDPNYFPARSLQGNDPGMLREGFETAAKDVLGGSNVTKYATGNASQATGFGYGKGAGDPYTHQTPNGERYGIENRPSDIAWAQRMQAKESAAPSTQAAAPGSDRLTPAQYAQGRTPAEAAQYTPAPGSQQPAGAPAQSQTATPAPTPAATRAQPAPAQSAQPAQPPAQAAAPQWRVRPDPAIASKGVLGVGANLGGHIDQNGIVDGAATPYLREKLMGEPQFRTLPPAIQRHIATAPNIDLNKIAPYRSKLGLSDEEMRTQQGVIFEQVPQKAAPPPAPQQPVPTQRAAPATPQQPATPAQAAPAQRTSEAPAAPHTHPVTDPTLKQFVQSPAGQRLDQVDPTNPPVAGEGSRRVNPDVYTPIPRQRPAEAPQPPAQAPALTPEVGKAAVGATREPPPGGWLPPDFSERLRRGMEGYKPTPGVIDQLGQPAPPEAAPGPQSGIELPKLTPQQGPQQAFAFAPPEPPAPVAPYVPASMAGGTQGQPMGGLSPIPWSQLSQWWQPPTWGDPMWDGGGMSGFGLEGGGGMDFGGALGGLILGGE